MKHSLNNENSSFLNKRYFFLIISLFFIFYFQTSYCQIYINEFQASNSTSVPEIYDFDNYSDWIELYNDGDKSVDLTGFSITDNIENPTKWIMLSGTTIHSKGFIRFWADGREAIPNQTFERPWDWSPAILTKFYHIPFKLSKSGEEIALFDSAGNLVDHVTFGPQLTDVSYGRKPDGADTWFYFGEPTPNKANNSTGIHGTEFNEPPQLLPNGGFFNEKTKISVKSKSPNSLSRFTTDGSSPTEQSSIFNSSFDIDSTITIRAKSYKTDKLPSKIETQTYIFDTNRYSLPIISITTDPKLLWSDTFGIYKNSIKQRKIPIKFEYFPFDRVKSLSTNAFMRISGEWSFKYNQKSFTITSSSKIGDDYLNYYFFHNVNNDKFKNLYLRNSGTPDNHLTMFRDALCHSLVIDDMNIDAQAYQPAVTYLNGKFWGIYNIREKLKNDYFSYRHNADPNNINLLEYDANSEKENGKIVIYEGDDNSYKQLLDFIENNSLKDETNYSYVSSQIDIDEYMNFIITQLFIGNGNWVVSNMKWWREKKEGSKWRWLLLDTDRAFGEEGSVKNNHLGRLLSGYFPSWSTSPFSKLIENEKFQNEFIQRFAAYLNTTFRPERTISMIDSIQDYIKGAMVNHIKKWDIKEDNRYPIHSMNNWEKYVQAMRDFAADRPKHQRVHILDQFGLQNMYNLDLSESGDKGRIYINGVNIPRETMSSGKYFSYIPIRLEAVPLPGYKFVKWKGISTDNKISLKLSRDTKVTAIFAPTNECVILSEINDNYTLDNSCGYYIALEDIIVNEGATLNIEPGIEIRMGQSTNLYINGNLNILGTNNNPVIIKPNSNIGATAWGGIIFDNTTKSSSLNNLKLIEATKGDKDLFLGAISGINSNIALKNVEINNAVRPFYSNYGSISIDNCSFNSSNTIDLINIKYADSAIIKNCIFKGSSAKDADAIDLDGVKNGVIDNNAFLNFTGSNSDGIDLGEGSSNILITNNYIKNIFDKGISVGQGSKAIIKNNVIIGCSQGVGIKDFGSFASIDHNTFYKNDIGVACFEKNIGKGGAKAKINNSILSSSSSEPFFIDDKSEISITYSLSDTKKINGTGNININPLFVNAAQLNLELKSNSPCINSGDPNCPKDPDGTRADMGAKFSFDDSVNNYKIVINEINYNSRSDASNTGDWVELFNYGNTDVDLSNWIFMDEKNSHKFVIPQGTILKQKEYLIISNNRDKFISAFGHEYPIVGDFSFKLDNKGDIVRLFDSGLKEVDFVNFKDLDSWSTFAAGNGGSLMLLDYTKDNSQASNWFNKFGFPTPGKDNHFLNIDFDYRHKYSCSGIAEVKIVASGLIDKWQWIFGDNKVSNEYITTHIYKIKGPDTIKLSYTSNGISNLIIKPIKIIKIFNVPIVEDKFSCGSSEFELNTTDVKKTFWYYDKDVIEPFWIGEKYKTPKLTSTTTYYVSNGYHSICTSDRVPIKASVLDTVIADFRFKIDKGRVTFENKSKNAFNSTWDFGDNTIEINSDNLLRHFYNKTGLYDVKLFAEGKQGFCKDTSYSFVPITEIDSSIASWTLIYPNPVIKNLNIEFLKKDKVNIKIFDLNGAILFDKFYTQSTNKEFLNLDLSSFTSGTYIIKIKTDNDEYSKKIIKY